MWKLSKGSTVASYRDVLIHEIRAGLARYFPNIRQTSLVYLGSGMAHAFGRQRPPFRLDAAIRNRLPLAFVDAIESARQVMTEKAVISGVSPFVPEMARFGPTAHGEHFRDHLDNLGANLATVPAENREEALYGPSLGDIIQPLIAVLGEEGRGIQDLLALGVQTVTEFVDRLPSRRIDLHLHRQVLKNPSLRSKLSDLEDWGGLGPAAAYCDLVVCEKHFADLIGRDQFETHATFLTSLSDLAMWLHDLGK